VITDPRFFMERGISHVLSLGPDTPPPNIPLSGREHINIGDVPTADIGRYLRKAVTFIAAARHSGRTVYVHCAAGISRSTTCVCAYLMTHLDLTFERALMFVSTKRKSVCPNEGFVRTLRQFEASAERKTLQHELERQCPNYRDIRQLDIDEVSRAVHIGASGSSHRSSSQRGSSQRVSSHGRASYVSAKKAQPPSLVEAQAQQQALRAVRQAMAGHDVSAGQRFGRGESKDDVGLGWLLGNGAAVPAANARSDMWLDDQPARRNVFQKDPPFSQPRDSRPARFQKDVGGRAMSTPEYSLEDRPPAGRPSFPEPCAVRPRRPSRSTGPAGASRFG